MAITLKKDLLIYQIAKDDVADDGADAAHSDGQWESGPPGADGEYLDNGHEQDGFGEVSQGLEETESRHYLQEAHNYWLMDYPLT